MDDKQVAFFLDSAWFGILRQKVFVNGVNKSKFKYLEVIEIVLADESNIEKLQSVLGGQKSKKLGYHKLRLTGTKAAAACKKYESLLDKKKNKAKVILELSQDKETRVTAPIQKQHYRESLWKKIKVA